MSYTIPPPHADRSWWKTQKLATRIRNQGYRPVICPFCALEIQPGSLYRAAWSGVYGAHAGCAAEEIMRAPTSLSPAVETLTHAATTEADRG